jgi:hypothetical protein
MISTLNVPARYFSIFLLCAGPFVGLNIQISWETTVVPRPRTKRAALIAIANCVSSVSDARLLYTLMVISADFDVGVSLVHAVLFPPEPGTKVPDRRRRDYSWLRPHCHLMLGCEMVGDEEE